jgi:hypothetical protein
MFKLMLTTAVLIGTTVPTLAETYVYQCCRGGVYPDGPVNARRCHGAGILATVKVDEDKATLTWRGTTFTNLKVTTEETQAKYSWRATRDGLTADLSVATQGVADLTIGKAAFSCQQLGR